MLLTISDGTTTVTLSGTSPVRGCTYFPVAAQMRDGEYQPVTETAVVNMIGTAAAIRTTVNTIEGLLRFAADRQRTGVGPRVFVLYKPVDADSAAYRSEVYDGRVVWSDNPGLRRLGDTNPPAQVGVIWTRAFWWEGDEAELSISATGQAAATGGRTINNDPANGNWVQAAAAQVTGVLPAPLRVHLINNTISTQNYRRVLMGVNSYSDPANFVHYLQGEARLSGGSSTADASSSGGAVLEFTASTSPTTFQWTLPQADMQRTRGRRFRVLGRFEGTLGPLYVRPDIRTSGGGVLWQGDELALASPIYEAWQDFGVVPLLPGGDNALYAAARLGLTFRGAGSVYLDVLQLTALDSYRHIETVGTGVATANGAALIHDGIEGQTYLQGGGVRTPVPASFGGPLLFQPGVINRLHVLHQVNAGQTAGAGDAPIAGTMSVRLYYRPRRLTV